MEIHPETPLEGMPMTRRFRPEDIERIMGQLRSRGAPFGITFADRSLLSNSSLALQAAEFAREHNLFNPFHVALFTTYFSHGLNIGNIDVLAMIAKDAGLDVEAMKQALQNKKYLPRLAAIQKEAAVRGVTGVPTFFIGEKKSVVGAQSLDVFRNTLRST
jgi:predicted DsbA family dithiol-disulfide isomerase